MINILYVFIGGSASGKNLLQETISKKFNIPICVSYSSRPKRENETNGVDYYFTSKEEFVDMLGNDEFVEFRSYETADDVWYYGLHKSEVVDANVKNKITIVDQNGYYSLVKELGQENVLGFYIYAPERVKIIRALNRETVDNESFYKELYRRMLDDLTAFEKVKRDNNVVKIENIDLDKAVEEINKYINL
jgi:guanylate kinase